MEAMRPIQVRVSNAWLLAESQRKVGAYQNAGYLTYLASGVKALEVEVCGQDAVGADEAEDLEQEREEGGEVDEAQGAEEKPAGDEVVGQAVCSGEEVVDELARGLHFL